MLSRTRPCKRQWWLSDYRPLALSDAPYHATLLRPRCLLLAQDTFMLQQRLWPWRLLLAHHATLLAALHCCPAPASPCLGTRRSVPQYATIRLPRRLPLMRKAPRSLHSSSGFQDTSLQRVTLRTLRLSVIRLPWRLLLEPHLPAALRHRPVLLLIRHSLFLSRHQFWQNGLYFVTWSHSQKRAAIDVLYYRSDHDRTWRRSSSALWESQPN